MNDINDSLFEKYKDLFEKLEMRNSSNLELMSRISKQLKEQKGQYYEMCLVNEQINKLFRAMVDEYDTLMSKNEEVKKAVSEIAEKYKLNNEEIETFIRNLGHVFKAEKDIEELEKVIEEHTNNINEKEDEIKSVLEEIDNIEKTVADYKNDEAYKKKVEEYNRLQAEKDLLESQLKKANEEKRAAEEEKKIYENENAKSPIASVYGNNKEEFDKAGKAAGDVLACSISINKNLGEVKEHFHETEESISNMNKQTSRLISIWNGVVNVVKNANDYWRQVEDRTFRLSRAMGAGKEQARTFFKSQLMQTIDLAHQYGMTQEEMMRFQQSYTEATGRAIFLTKQETEELAAMSQLSSPEIANELSEGLSKMGMSINDTATVFGVVNARARALGLNASKATAEVAKNIDKLNRYNFKSGVDGLTRMVLRAKELRVNVDDMLGAVDKFGNIEDAITNSAKLQVLGGSFANSASNPMGLMYQSMADPTALAKSVEGMVKGLAVMNRSTGEMDVSAVDYMRIKAASEALGMSMESLMQMTKSLAKETEVSSFMGTRMNKFSDAQKATLKNKAQWDAQSQTFKIDILGADGKSIESKDIRNITEEDLKALGENTLDEENAFRDIRAIANVVTGRNFRDETKSRAKATISDIEVDKGGKESLLAAEAKFLDPILNGIKDIKKALWALVANTALKGPLGRLLVLLGHMAIGGGWAFLKSKAGNFLERTVQRRVAGSAANSAAGSAAGSSSTSIFQSIKNFFKKGGSSAGGSGSSTAGRSSTSIFQSIKNFFKKGGSSAGGSASPTSSPAKPGVITRFKNRVKAYNRLRRMKNASSAANATTNAGTRISELRKLANAKNAIQNIGPGIKNFVGNAIKFSNSATGKILGRAGAALTVLNAGMSIYNSQKEASAKKNAIKSTNVLNEESKTRAIETAKSENIVKTSANIGKAVGAIAGNFIPIVGPLIGTTIGAVAGNVVGKVVGKGINLVRNFTGEKRTNEQKAKSAVQVAFERQKIDATTVEDPQIMEKGALATIAIHSLLVSYFNKKDGRREDGSRKGVLEKLGFAEGGIVPGTSYKGDNVPAMLNSGEMVLNQDTQKNLFNILKIGGNTNTSTEGNVAKSVVNNTINSNIEKVVPVIEPSSSNSYNTAIANSDKTNIEGDVIQSNAKSSISNTSNSKVAPISEVAKNVMTFISNKIKGEQSNIQNEIIANNAKSSINSTSNSIDSTVEKIAPIIENGKNTTFISSGKGVNNNETTFNDNTNKNESIVSNFIKSLLIKNNKNNVENNETSFTKSTSKNESIISNFIKSLLVKGKGVVNNETTLNENANSNESIVNSYIKSLLVNNKANSAINSNVVKNGKEIEMTPVEYLMLRQNMKGPVSLTKNLENNKTLIYGSSSNASAIQSPSVVPMKPIGEKTIVSPSIERIQYTNEKSETPSDINININGSIRLEGNGLGNNFNLNELLKDEGFKRQLANIVKERLNSEGNASKLNKESSVINTQKLYNRT